MMLYPLALASSMAASLLRFGAGAAGAPTEAATPPILYEFEGCPFCRIAREAVSAAGLAVMVRPCPKGGKRFRPQVETLGGKAQFPYFIDPNTDSAMYESAAIVRYIVRTYGGARPVMHFTGPLNAISSQLAVLARAMAGAFRSGARAPAAALIFTGAERDPRARLVKERLCAMELEYHWRPERGAPALHDPNTNLTTIGAPAVLGYLKATYAL